jgi:hypothetical protein
VKYSTVIPSRPKSWQGSGVCAEIPSDTGRTRSALRCRPTSKVRRRQTAVRLWSEVITADRAQIHTHAGTYAMAAILEHQSSTTTSWWISVPIECVRNISWIWCFSTYSAQATTHIKHEGADTNFCRILETIRSKCLVRNPTSAVRVSV